MTDEVRAAGADPDSRRREVKTRLAAAEAAGDTKEARALRAELDRLSAAANRAATADAGGPPAAKSPPTGRSVPAKSTTAKS